MRYLVPPEQIDRVLIGNSWIDIKRGTFKEVMQEGMVGGGPLYVEFQGVDGGTYSCDPETIIAVRRSDQPAASTETV